MRTIVHLSDVHFGRFDAALVEPLASTIRGIGADLVAISGDLTQRARPWQFEAARRFIDALKARTLVVPGNHDVPLWNVAARFLTPLGNYTRHITSDLNPVYEDEEVIVVGVNTARSLAWGEGRISDRQVTRLAATLGRAAPSAIRVVVTHHPFDLPPGSDERHLVGRARMAMTKLAAAGADLFLAGHLHLSHIGHSAERYRTAGHSALIVQAGTVSMRGRGEQPSFNLLRVQRPNIEVSRFIWHEDARTFVETAADRFSHTDTGWARAV